MVMLKPLRELSILLDARKRGSLPPDLKSDVREGLPVRVRRRACN